MDKYLLNILTVLACYQAHLLTDFITSLGSFFIVKINDNTEEHD